MNKKIKNVLTTTIISAVTLTAIGCNSNNTKLSCESANQKTKCHQNLECNIKAANALSNDKIGKIIETSFIESANTRATSNTSYSQNNTDSNSQNNQNLYTLSSTPFISISNEDGGYGFIFHATFSTNQPTSYMNESVADETISMKKSILKLYLNELYSGNIMLDDTCRNEIKTQLNTLQSGTEMTETMARNSSQTTLTNNHQVNAYDSIITILESNLLPNSPYFSNKISNVCDKLENHNYTATLSTEDKEIAESISNLLNIKNQTNNQNSTPILTESNQPASNTNQDNESTQIKNLNINQNNNSRMLNNEPTVHSNNSTISNGSITDNNQNANSTNTQYRNGTVNSRQSRNVRRNRNGNMSTNSSLMNSNTNSPVSRNHYASTSNMNEGTKIMRAERNQDTNQTEEYQKTANSNITNERAQRMPYTRTTTFNQ